MKNRHPLPADFRRLWTADTVSQAGSAVTLLALPLVAIGALDATAFEAGLLVMSEYLAFLLIGLPAGAWVDRLRHRPVMIAGDLGRAALLLSVPAAAWLDVLSLPQLYAVAFGMSVCTVFFDVAAQSALPRLVDADRLADANVRLETTRNITQVGGPGLAGALVGALTAPVALAADAASYLLSAFLVSRVRRPEPRPAARGGTGLRAEIAEGLRFLLGDRTLRAITAASAVSNLFGTVGAAMLMVLLAGSSGCPRCCARPCSPPRPSAASSAACSPCASPQRSARAGRCAPPWPSAGCCGCRPYPSTGTTGGSPPPSPSRAWAGPPS